MNAFLATHSPKILSLLRFITGFLILWHGSGKLFAYPPGSHVADSPLMIFGGVVEFVGGILVMIGLGTRWAAFLLSGMMAVAYFMAHAPSGLFSPKTGTVEGELAILYCFVFFYLFYAGGGPLSVDALISKSRRSN
jgi:putative oxidoreductase